MKKCTQEGWGYSIQYLTDLVGVKIIFEFREAFVFIMLYKLIDGVLVENSFSKG